MYKIMIVDDDLISALIVQKLLEIKSFSKETFLFQNAQNGLTYLYENPLKLPDLILLDTLMPMMNGWDFLDKLQVFFEEKRLHIPVFMISALIDEKTSQKALNYHCVKQMFEKPINVQHIDLMKSNLVA